MPVDYLMQEHRLIERMVSQMRNELARMQETGKVDSKFVDTAVDFIKVYADRCHHGKEEGILFRSLGTKQMSDEHAKIVRTLIEEHVYGRKTTAKLAAANNAYAKSDVTCYADVWKLMNDLVEFYPKHIEKEDKVFFYPSMEYFSTVEQEAMMREFWEFDRKIIHEHYAKVLAELENRDSNTR